MLTGSPSDQMHVAIVDAATFTVKKRIPMIASATVPGYVDIDPEGGRVYVTTKWSPTVVVFDSKAERVLRYIDLGGFGPRVRGGAHARQDTPLHPLGTPAQSAVVVDVKTLTVIANIVDTDLIGPRPCASPTTRAGCRRRTPGEPPWGRTGGHPRVFVTAGEECVSSDAIGGQGWSGG